VFKKPFKQQHKPLEESIIKSYRFLRWGGYVYLEDGRKIPARNTCNIDNVITVLYCISNYSAVANKYFETLFKAAKTSLKAPNPLVRKQAEKTLVIENVLNKFRLGDPFEAKAIWIKEFCNSEELWYESGCDVSKGIDLMGNGMFKSPIAISVISI